MLLRCKKLFDGFSSFHDKLVLIDNGTISKISDSFSAIEGAKDFLECKFLMPGPVDSHVHISGYSERERFGSFKPIHSFLSLCLLNGITTLVDCGPSILCIKT
ncbi:MAG TPA: hypothetical protein VJN71_05130 [Nitrososphaerales archaeon]|nr:hypothetical protein [Nitrososphaerales archaeon]